VPTYIKGTSPFLIKRQLCIVQVEMQVARPLIDRREHGVADVEPVAFAGWEGGGDFLQENAGSCRYLCDPRGIWKSDLRMQIIALAAVFVDA